MQKVLIEKSRVEKWFNILDNQPRSEDLFYVTEDIYDFLHHAEKEHVEYEKMNRPLTFDEIKINEDYVLIDIPGQKYQVLSNQVVTCVRKNRTKVVVKISQDIGAFTRGHRFTVSPHMLRRQ